MTVEDGQRLAAEAYATPPITPQNLGPVINGLVYFFSFLCLAITSLRAWVRIGGDQRWGWDDVLAVGALVSSLAVLTCCLLLSQGLSFSFLVDISVLFGKKTLRKKRIAR